MLEKLIAFCRVASYHHGICPFAPTFSKEKPLPKVFSLAPIRLYGIDGYPGSLVHQKPRCVYGCSSGHPDHNGHNQAKNVRYEKEWRPIMIKKIGVVGAGQMGAGIAQVAAMNGIAVVLNDIKDAYLESGLDRIQGSLARFLKKDRITEEEKNATMDRIETTMDVRPFGEVEFVVEAVTENESLKLDVFRLLDETCKQGVVLATNTSSIPITRIAAATRRPADVIGMHFMNPVPMMQLVEIIRGLATSDETYETTHNLAKALQKTPVAANDFPGFISNRILMPMINEAVFALFEGVGTAEAIDSVMKLGMNHPMGPLATADLIGLDTCLSIMEVLYEGFGDSKYRPCPLLRKYVDAGHLGRKTAQGFYTY